jgi:tartrate dehydratase beta subunit/fumarate hydratase class I family protein
MGEAFDRTCKSLRIIGCTVTVREIIAVRIIEAAKNGERDPARLYEQALIIFGIVDVSMPIVSVGRDPPSQPALWSRI